MATYTLTTPLSDADTRMLRAGDVVFLSGTVYTARDAAHGKIAALLKEGLPPPFPLEGAVIFYVGPSPAPEGRPIGSAGPTTSYRMDSYTPLLHHLGLKATIGKGKRDEAVKNALRTYGAVYFGATGGAGALLSMCIESVHIIAFEALGPEAIRELQVKNLPLLVINDSVGGELYAAADITAALE